MLKHVNVRGAKLAVYDKGQGPPLLLAHGFPLEHHMWEPQVREFRTTLRGSAVVLRGCGQSSAPLPTAASTMQDFAADCASVLDALKVDGPVTFCGLSMGGYIAWQFIDKFPERVAKLALCDTRAGADTPEAAAMRLKMAEH